MFHWALAILSRLRWRCSVSVRRVRFTNSFLGRERERPKFVSVYLLPSEAWRECEMMLPKNIRLMTWPSTTLQICAVRWTLGCVQSSGSWNGITQPRASHIAHLSSLSSHSRVKGMSDTKCRCCGDTTDNKRAPELPKLAYKFSIASNLAYSVLHSKTLIWQNLTVLRSNMVSVSDNKRTDGPFSTERTVRSLIITTAQEMREVSLERNCESLYRVFESRKG